MNPNYGDWIDQLCKPQRAQSLAIVLEQMYDIIYDMRKEIDELKRNNNG